VDEGADIGSEGEEPELYHAPVTDFYGQGMGTLPNTAPAESTPLEIHEDLDGPVPPAPLWAMKDRRHHVEFPGTEVENDHLIREVVGSGDLALYFIDDGREHCMVARRVGATAEGLVYCLIGRVKIEDYEDLLNANAAPTEIFSKAHDISLCAVSENDADASEVTLIEHYRHSSDIPADYLPPSPFIEFESIDPQ
jgi:hypothetical protein